MASEKRRIYRDAETMYRLLSQEGIVVSDQAALLDKVKQLQRGLPVEAEFALLCLWSGRCKALHRLERSILDKRAGMETPDYMAVFSFNGKDIAVLVEVKYSEIDTIKFTRKYFAGLQTYSKIVGLPVLVAYKCTKLGRPLWSLFELQHMAQPNGTGKANILEMMKQDLTYILLGMFHIQIWKGARLVLEWKKEKVIDDESFEGMIQAAYWETPAGKRVDGVSYLHWLFMLSEDDVEIEERDGIVVQRFIKLHDDSVISSWALPLAVDLGKALRGDTINWDAALADSDLRFYLPDLRSAMQEAVRQGLVRYIFNVKPHTMPAFLVT